MVSLKQQHGKHEHDKDLEMSKLQQGWNMFGIREQLY